MLKKIRNLRIFKILFLSFYFLPHYSKNWLKYKSNQRAKEINQRINSNYLMKIFKIFLRLKKYLLFRNFKF